jgi:hypothetical protein
MACADPLTQEIDRDIEQLEQSIKELEEEIEDIKVELRERTPIAQDKTVPTHESPTSIDPSLTRNQRSKPKLSITLNIAQEQLTPALATSSALLSTQTQTPTVNGNGVQDRQENTGLEAPNSSHVLRLPDELLLEVVSYLDYENFWNFATTCRDIKGKLLPEKLSHIGRLLKEDNFSENNVTESFKRLEAWQYKLFLRKAPQIFLQDRYQMRFYLNNLERLRNNTTLEIPKDPPPWTAWLQDEIGDDRTFSAKFKAFVFRNGAR